MAEEFCRTVLEGEPGLRALKSVQC